MNPQLEKRLVAILAACVGGLTPAAIFQRLRIDLPDLDRRGLHSVISGLVMKGRLSYMLRFGSTCVTLGGYQPELVSERIYLAVRDYAGNVPDKAICLKMDSGIAFGAGDHPTTCLMLRALDQAMEEQGRSKANAVILDVGTGNGVLSIAGLLLGAGEAVGMDIDAQACHEAGINAAINGVEKRFTIIAGSVEALGARRFHLVLANLRPPTLVALLPALGTLVEESGALILSGFRRSEWSGVASSLPSGMHVVWQEYDRDWAVIIARRGSRILRAATAHDPEGR